MREGETERERETERDFAGLLKKAEEGFISHQMNFLGGLPEQT